MRHLLSASAVFLFSFLIAACTSDGTPGVLLKVQLYPTMIGPRPTDTIPAGSMIEYLGEIVLDSTLMKVRFKNIGEGYVGVSEVVLNARPGFILRDAESFESDGGSDATGLLPGGTIVAVDTSTESRSRVIFLGTDDEQHEAWVSSAAIEYDLDRNFKGPLSQPRRPQ